MIENATYCKCDKVASTAETLTRLRGGDASHPHSAQKGKQHCQSFCTRRVFIAPARTSAAEKPSLAESASSPALSVAALWRKPTDKLASTCPGPVGPFHEFLIGLLFLFFFLREGLSEDV